MHHNLILKEQVLQNITFFSEEDQDSKAREQ